MNAIIAWFTRNGVAANLLVILIVVAGLFSAYDLKREVFPEFEAEIVTITVKYLGAAPEEVEEGVCVRIEEAIQSLEQIKKLTSTAAEGVGNVMVELLPGADISRALDEIKNQVDAIDTFPEETEKPLIQQLLLTKQVINVAISGDIDERSLKQLAERTRDELTALPGITQVKLANARPYEISIEVSEAALRRFNLTFDEVAQAVRRSSLDLPGGSVRTRGGEILIRTKGQAYLGTEFSNLPLRTRPDGTRLLVGDVATVVDGFAETDQSATFDGRPSVLVQVFRVGDQNALAISELVQNYVRENQSRLPPGVSMTTWQDDASYLRSRLSLLTRNGITGLALVFMVLAMFLRIRLALWVSLGLVVSFLGALWFMPMADVSINLLSLFAFILVLGIVVDDAIVVSENIYTHQERHEGGLNGAIAGAQEVVKPVIFAVLTTVAAFVPLMGVPGNTGKIISVIPLVVIPTLLFSLVESLLVLPSHLSHLRPAKSLAPKGAIAAAFHRFQRGFSSYVDRFINGLYGPFLATALRFRYLTAAVAVAILIFTLGLVGGGWIKFVFFPSVEGDNVAAMLTMPLGTPASVTKEAVRQIESTALQLRETIDAETSPGSPSVFRHVLASVATQPYLTAQRQGGGQIGGPSDGAHLGEIHIELAPSEDRVGSSTEIANRWRDLTGSIPDAVELTFTASIFSSGEPINVQLTGLNFAKLRAAADELKQQLEGYSGVTDISDTFRAGKQEVKLHIKPSAEALGLTQSDLGRQVRQAFYGEEVQRIQRGRDELRVMVRYPEEDRRSLGDLEEMRVRTPSGAEVPFSAVAQSDLGRGYASIKRVDRKRAISVTADIDQTKGNTQEILANLKQYLPGLMARNPGIAYSLEGEQREQQETVQGILRGYPLALMLIYALLAVPFRSYLQPFIVMSAIPFGFVGAVWGHIIMGMDLTILSMFGIVALSGVVVNDNLVLVDFINRSRATGIDREKAVRNAGVARFRPIILTSLTTFAGLTPLLLEPSVQAKFLVPMAISLGFGVMFATSVSLLLVPAGYLILEDIQRIFRSGSDTTP